MTTTVGQELVPHQPPSIPVLWAADQGVASSLESVLSDNTRRVYGTQWRIFAGWCDEVGLTSLPAEPLTVARYVAARANSGASIATIRLATSAISKAHEWAKLETPCRDPGVRASLKGWGRRLSKPQRQSGALTADVLAVIRLTAVQPRKRGRGIETPDQAAERGRFDVALVAVLSDGGLRRSEASSLTWGDVQRWDGRQRSHHRGPLQDRRGGPGRRGRHHPRRDGRTFRHPGGGGWWWGEGVRAVGVPDRPAGEGDRQGRGVSRIGSSSAATAGGWAWPAAWPRTAPPPTRSSARAAGNRAAAWSGATPAARLPVRLCGIYNSYFEGASYLGQHAGISNRR